MSFLDRRNAYLQTNSFVEHFAADIQSIRLLVDPQAAESGSLPKLTSDASVTDGQIVFLLEYYATSRKPPFASNRSQKSSIYQFLLHGSM
jgi:hypothetical protein